MSTSGKKGGCGVFFLSQSLVVRGLGSSQKLGPQKQSEVLKVPLKTQKSELPFKHLVGSMSLKTEMVWCSDKTQER